MNSIPVDAMAPKAQQRANPNPRFSLIETAQDAFAAEMSAQEPGMRGPLWNEAGARDVEGMRPPAALAQAGARRSASAITCRAGAFASAGKDRGVRSLLLDWCRSGAGIAYRR